MEPHNVKTEPKLWLIVEHVLLMLKPVSTVNLSVLEMKDDRTKSSFSGGTCYIWMESYTNKATNVLEHEIINRSCDIKDLRSMNTYSELSSKADNMKICNGDLCNAPDLTGSSSLLAPALAALLIALL